MSIANVRARIEQAAQERDRAEGEAKALQAEIELSYAELRKILGCEQGQEAETIRALQAEVEEDESSLGELLEAAEETRAE